MKGKKQIEKRDHSFGRISPIRKKKTDILEEKSCRT